MDRSSPENLILVTREPEGIAHVTINRPKSLNSLTKPMMTDLARAFRSLDADDSVRVVVLSGSGRSFCSGVDLTAAEDVFKGDVKDKESDPVVQMERCRKPIIGAISGFAVTAGFEIALACDVLVAAKGAKFMDTHARTLHSVMAVTRRYNGLDELADDEGHGLDALDLLLGAEELALEALVLVLDALLLDLDELDVALEGLRAGPGGDEYED
ncbi:enoyl-CoA hydratase/isomerase A [Actinidia rufa]|uniref:Enoyl-CoA hydratase/isomerase A n=1 Tax=Actinidia rufa TaxID=165716 RepID=A0A7J0GL57_9ERIC|nr:enoyl-CoA hydratase/isomerase A [Actinidia rufa]